MDKWTSVDMVQFALRLDYKSEYYDRVLAILCLASRYFAVIEDGDQGQNTHIHAIMYSDKKLAALRKAIQRQFPEERGNGFYSLKECDQDIDAYMRYMCKGSSKESMPVILGYCGLDYNKSSIVDWHNAYWVNNEALAKNKKKRKGKDAGTVTEILEKRCKEKKIRADEREKIAHEYIRMYAEWRKPINVFAARAVVNTVCVILEEDGGTITNQLAYRISEL